ncbi:MFS transporter [Thermosipho ferrireducens]|uniref:MFS transporter n=1 Tax=Thermosipho ferrireducens TaxID=2571116 RepID=A0ABX7S821_9BACT|nr:MFS transporter [Thermosipho ferrireducens]QTA37260.1 MFS transporter [Thermosipho ferrireducens]
MEKIFTYTSILIISIVINTLAPLMSTLQESLNISIATSSWIPVVSLFGTTVFSLIISVLMSRIGVKTANNLGFAFILSGSVLFFVSKTISLVLISVFLIGSGTALLFTSLTTLLAHTKNPKYGLTHAFFGMGGILAPLFVREIISKNIEYNNLYLIYAFAVAIFIVWNIFSKFPETRYEKLNFFEIRTILKKPIVYITIISLLLYSGSEIGVITWAGNLFLHFGISKVVAASAISIFWITYTISRMFSDFLGEVLGEKFLIYVVTITSSITVFLIIVFKDYHIFWVLGAIMGPIFPTIQKYANMRLGGREVGLLNGLTYAFTGIGAMLISGIMGAISNFDISLMYLIPALGLFLVFIMQLFELKQSKQGGN